eukprot:3215363-Pyramimonas_sp.AAC.1
MKLQRWQQFHRWKAVGFQNVALALAPSTFALNIGKASRVEGGWFSQCGSRLSAAHIRHQHCHAWRAGGFQNVALALAPHTFVIQTCKNFVGGGCAVFNCGSRLNAVIF